jgi:hypothetical protein
MVGLAPAAAHAHGRAGLQSGYVSTVTTLAPNVVGVDVRVLGGDDRLRFSNYSGTAETDGFARAGDRRRRRCGGGNSAAGEPPTAAGPQPLERYGDGVSVGQFGAVAPFESAQLIRPFGNAFTTGLSGECAAT